MTSGGPWGLIMVELGAAPSQTKGAETNRAFAPGGPGVGIPCCTTLYMMGVSEGERITKTFPTLNALRRARRLTIALVSQAPATTEYISLLKLGCLLLLKPCLTSRTQNLVIVKRIADLVLRGDLSWSMGMIRLRGERVPLIEVAFVLHDRWSGKSCAVVKRGKLRVMGL